MVVERKKEPRPRVGLCALSARRLPNLGRVSLGTRDPSPTKNLAAQQQSSIPPPIFAPTFNVRSRNSGYLRCCHERGGKLP